MTDQPPIPLGDDLRQRRRTAGYTTRTLADACETSHWTIIEAENERAVPESDVTVAAIADLLGDVTPASVNGETIAAIREDYQVSQTALGEMCEVAPGTIGRWEAGRSPQPHRYQRLVSSLLDAGYIDAHGSVVPNTDPALDGRPRSANTRTSGDADLLRAVIDGVQRYIDTKPFMSTLTTAALSKTVMSDSEYRKQRIGNALRLLTDEPRPADDGFRLTPSRKGVDAPTRYAIDRDPTDISASDMAAEVGD
jgi:DNA-binding XRE family transcriptional regulator